VHFAQKPALQGVILENRSLFVGLDLRRRYGADEAVRDIVGFIYELPDDFISIEERASAIVER